MIVICRQTFIVVCRLLLSVVGLTSVVRFLIDMVMLMVMLMTFNVMRVISFDAYKVKQLVPIARLVAPETVEKATFFLDSKSVHVSALVVVRLGAHRAELCLEVGATVLWLSA